MNTFVVGTCFKMYPGLVLFIFVCAWSSVLLGLFSSCSEQGLPSCCRAQALGCTGSVVVVLGLHVALWHVGSSWKD